MHTCLHLHELTICFSGRADRSTNLRRFLPTMSQTYEKRASMKKEESLCDLYADCRSSDLQASQTFNESAAERGDDKRPGGRIFLD